MINQGTVGAHSRPALLQVFVALSGLFYLLTGFGLLFAPAWFFTHIGTFPPFNRHYAGDLGAFLLPLGTGLLLASRNPSEHKMLLGVAAAGTLLHALNHTYDLLTGSDPVEHWLMDGLPLLLFGGLWLAALRNLARS